MRISPLVASFITSIAIAVTGCGGVEPAPETQQAPIEQTVADPNASSGGEVIEMATCQRMWTCYIARGPYYSTYSACTADCGTRPCVQDYNCNGFCVCP
jgi:hypothetical protein